MASIGRTGGDGRHAFVRHQHGLPVRSDSEVLAVIRDARSPTLTQRISGCDYRVEGLSPAALTRRCRRLPWEHHLRLNHHCGKLSVRAVYRDLQDDHAPAYMDRHSDASKPSWPAGAKD